MHFFNSHKGNSFVESPFGKKGFFIIEELAHTAAKDLLKVTQFEKSTIFYADILTRKLGKFVVFFHE